MLSLLDPVLTPFPRPLTPLERFSWWWRFGSPTLIRLRWLARMARHRLTPSGRREARALREVMIDSAYILRMLAASVDGRQVAYGEVGAALAELLQHAPAVTLAVRASIEGVWGEFQRLGGTKDGGPLYRATSDELAVLGCHIGDVFHLAEWALRAGG